jgi:hypothetical protein
MCEYECVMSAARIISERQLEVSKEDGPNLTSPAWTLLFHAKTYLLEQADQILRGPKPVEEVAA